MNNKKILKRKRSCSNCVKGIKIAVNSDILCREHGVVSPDYVCANHRYMPAKKTFKDLNYKCIDCENFIVSCSHSKNKATIGICQLFSVRKFDGSKRSACSRFIKKQNLEVS